ncbi:cytosine permease [Citricoccus sp. NR2]|uniref:cytosine permease n=1 Tax=Citricoccus sp. NR2 TaxID=3004095 RepID=UPI0022DE44FA|nr:cytosine permease [Citricoccus sp. NR2]WBL20085.1 cytosine permease [Citricoccus sp. NR2]
MTTLSTRRRPPSTDGPGGTAPDSTLTPVIDTDYPDGPVPRSARRPTLSLVIVVTGFFFYTPTMVTGGTVAAQFGFAPYLGLALIATVILAAYIALLAVASARTGLTTVLLARLVLGRWGGKWASLILGGTQVGWYAITIGILGDLVAAAFGWSISWPVILLGGVLMATTAYVGFKGIEALSWISIPAMAILCGIVFVRSMDHVGGWSGLMATTGLGEMSAGLAITLMIGTFVSGGTQIGNWSRFDRGSTTRVLLMTAAAVIVVQFGMLFFGGIGSAAFGEADFVTLLMTMGMVGAAVVLLVANLWTTNDNAAYAFGVAGAELFERPSKSPFIIGGVAVAITLALTGVADALTGFLVLVGILIPPLGGALIGTFFLAWRGVAPQDGALAAAPRLRVPGVVAYLVGAASALASNLIGWGSPALLGIVSATVIAGAVGLAQFVSERSSDHHS